MELNEDGINAKSEWVIESWTSFDIRLDGSTPFPGTRTFGGALKNSWDDPATYHSQIAGWIDDRQVKYGNPFIIFFYKAYKAKKTKRVLIGEPKRKRKETK